LEIFSCDRAEIEEYTRPLRCFKGPCTSYVYERVSLHGKYCTFVNDLDLQFHEQI
jgi:hypothetical protein